LALVGELLPPPLPPCSNPIALPTLLQPAPTFPHRCTSTSPVASCPHDFAGRTPPIFSPLSIFVYVVLGLPIFFPEFYALVCLVPRWRSNTRPFSFLFFCVGSAKLFSGFPRLTSTRCRFFFNPPSPLWILFFLRAPRSNPVCRGQILFPQNLFMSVSYVLAFHPFIIFEVVVPGSPSFVSDQYSSQSLAFILAVSLCPFPCHDSPFVRVNFSISHHGRGRTRI